MNKPASRPSDLVSDDGWNISAWFALLSPMLGIIAGYLALLLLFP